MKQASGILPATPTRSAVRIRTSQRRCVASAACASEQQASTGKRTRVSSECVERSREKGSQALGRGDGDRRRLPMLITSAQSVHRCIPTDHDGDRRRKTPEASRAGWDGNWLERRIANARVNNDRRWWRRGVNGVRRPREPRVGKEKGEPAYHRVRTDELQATSPFPPTYHCLQTSLGYIHIYRHNATLRSIMDFKRGFELT